MVLLLKGHGRQQFLLDQRLSCKVPAYLIYPKTLNLIFSAYGQNIKNLVGNFGDIYVRIMHANFHLSSIKGIEGGGGGGGGDKRMDNGGHAVSQTSHSLRSGGINQKLDT